MVGLAYIAAGQGRVDDALALISEGCAIPSRRGSRQSPPSGCRMVVGNSLQLSDWDKHPGDPQADPAGCPIRRSPRWPPRSDRDIRYWRDR